MCACKILAFVTNLSTSQSVTVSTTPSPWNFVLFALYNIYWAIRFSGWQEANVYRTPVSNNIKWYTVKKLQSIYIDIVVYTINLKIRRCGINAKIVLTIILEGLNSKKGCFMSVFLNNCYFSLFFSNASLSTVLIYYSIFCVSIQILVYTMRVRIGGVVYFCIL